MRLLLAADCLQLPRNSSGTRGPCAPAARTDTTSAQPAKMRMSTAAVFVALLAAPSLASAKLQGVGPAYWQEPARYPMHYPAGAAAVEGFVVNPMGGQSYCNGRLVKPGEA